MSPISRVVSAGGNAFADFLLAYPVSGSIGTPLDLGARVHNYSAFAQDDWHPSSRLTLNLGVRYEYITPVFDVIGLLQFVDTHLVRLRNGSQRLSSGNRMCIPVHRTRRRFSLSRGV